MSPAETFYAATGANFFLTLNDRAGIARYLAAQGLLGAGEELLSVRSAGEGNMNLTLRLTTNQGSYILKQSRTYVEKYPQVAAPVERSLTEAAFLRRAGQVTALADFTPRLLHLDKKNFTLFMQDLGDGGDLTTAYQTGQELNPATMELLVDYLSVLHGLPAADFPANLPLRRLNHEHLAVFPYLDAAATGFDPDNVVPGLADVAREIRADTALCAAAEATGRAYLAPGPCLLHGDFYPGSWLEVNGAIYVIDAEFAHPGRPEYDLGVMVAHLHFAGVADEQIHRLRARYQAPTDFEPRLVDNFAGLELIRRLIGLAQLPLSADLAQRKAWLVLGRRYLLSQ